MVLFVMTGVKWVRLAGEMVTIDDFHITNPLFQNNARDIHGWEIDGLVQTENDVLKFGGDKPGESIIKSFIPILSEKIVFETSLLIDFPNPAKDKESPKKNSSELVDGYLLLQIYPQIKIEVSSSNATKFSSQGVNFLLRKISSDSFMITYFVSKSTKKF